MVRTGALPVSLRIPQEVRSGIEEIVRRTGRDFSSVANEMLSEAVKMRRIPGITFRDGGAGRVARVSGSRITVYGVVGTYRAVDENWDALRQEYPWLSERDLRAALAYAEAYPEEIEEQLRREKSWTPEKVWTTYPFMKPRN